MVLRIRMPPSWRHPGHDLENNIFPNNVIHRMSYNHTATVLQIARRPSPAATETSQDTTMRRRIAVVRSSLRCGTHNQL